MSFPRTLILILLFAAGLRLYALGRASFWYDEFGSLEASTGRGLAHLQLPLNQIIVDPPHLTSLQNAPPAWRIWTSLDLDNHPPLYFEMLRSIRDLLGDSEWAVRLPSVIFSLMALIFFFLIVCTQLRPPAALVATALMAVAGSQIALAQEARPYSMFLAFSLGCGSLVVWMDKKRPLFPRWWFLFFLAGADLMTHYLAIPIVGSLLIYSLVRLRGRPRWAAITALTIGAVMFAGSWGISFLRQLHSASANNAWQYDDSPHHLLRVIWHLIQLPARWLSEPAANFAPAAILIFVICIYAAFRCGAQPGIFFWMLWCFPLILLIAATDIARHAQSLFFMRYTFAAAPALCFLAGASVQTFRRGWLVPATLCALCLVTLPDAYSKVMDWRNVAADLQSHAGPADTIIFTPGDNPVSWSQMTLMGISHYAPDLHSPVVILTDPSSDVVAKAFRKGHSTWVICFDPTIAPDAIEPAATVLRTGIASSMGRVSELQP